MKQLLSKINVERQAYYRHTKKEYVLFCRSLKNLKKTRFSPLQTPVFFCIGSDRIIGDCLGPLVGHKLKQLFPGKDTIYGTLKQPVHAQNMEQYLSEIYQRFKDPFCIAIDASLGSPDHVGLITLSGAPLSPGEGVKKNLPKVGDISITGIVNSWTGDPHLCLQNTRLNEVEQLSEFIFRGIASCFYAELSS